MKRYLPHIASILIIATIVAAPNLAHAQAISSLFGLGLSGFFTELFATTVNTLLMIMGWFLSLAGGLLNVSINLTLNIKAFVDATPAIFTTWSTIRDVSSLFIIFLLLYAALVKIVGVSSGPTYGSLIKNIVIFGILINFSFFITSLGIDASNIVSAQIYNAIAPSQSLNPSNVNFQDPSVVSRALNAGGISNIFAQALQITHIYNNAKFSEVDGGGAASAPFKVILMGLTGIVIEFAAAMSFILASMAFIARFVILLVLLAFSPIWFVAHMMPQIQSIQDKARQWSGMYYSMLIFMPVYLLLMYMALSVLTTSTVFQSGYAGNLVAGVAGEAWYANFLALGVNAFIVIFLLNMPLVVAMSMGGMATSWIDKTGLTGKQIWGRVGSTVGKWSHQGTVGRAASQVAEMEGFKNLASKSRVASLALKGTRAAASGYNATLAGQVKDRTAFADSLGADQKSVNAAQGRVRTAEQALAAAQSALASAATPGAVAIATAAVASAKRARGVAKSNVTTVQNQRRADYAGVTNTGSVDTLYTYVARKNKVAAAAIQIPVLEDRLTREKDDLKGTRDDIKTLSNAIRNNPAIGTPGTTGHVPAGTATAAQAAQIVALRGDEVRQVGEVNVTEAAIANLKLVK